jgi:hypothetical protein
LQFVFLLAAFAIAAVSVHADGLDIQNAYVTVPKEYTWTSVDSGPLETHYKTWELLVGFITMESCKPQLLLQMCVHVQMCEVVFVASSQQAHRVCLGWQTTQDNQCVYVCFTDLANFKYLDFYEKDK